MSESKSSNKRALSLSALGVVFGDIGTSPQYALKECLAYSHFDPHHPDLAGITGVFSLTLQAVQLSYMPRLNFVHTNPEVRDRIFMPQMNYQQVVLLSVRFADVPYWKSWRWITSMMNSTAWCFTTDSPSLRRSSKTFAPRLKEK